MASKCIICGEEVFLGNQEAHLRTKHATPVGGWRFWWDGACHFADKPSILVGDLHKQFGNPFGHVYQELDGKQHPLSDYEAVDLTHEPHFFVLLPATYGG